MNAAAAIAAALASSVDEWARKLGARIARIERDADRAAQFRQGVVLLYKAGPPRRADITVEGGTIPDVPLLTHHAAPSVADTVWIVRVVGGGWLYHGKQG